MALNEYHYYVWYNNAERKTVVHYKRESAVTVSSTKRLVAFELFDKIKERIEEIEQCEEYDTFIQITNISLLSQDNYPDK